MGETSVGELVKKAKGEDRSLREYARDSGVDAAVISKMINGIYIPKKPGIYEALTSVQAAPRGGVTCEQMIAAAGASKDFQNGLSAGISAGMLATLDTIPSSAMIKVLQARGMIVDSREMSGTLSSRMKPEEVRKIHHLQSEMQRFAATANGIILGSLGKGGLAFQAVQTEGTEVDKIHFDTCVKLVNHEISEYLIRYAFFSGEEAVTPALAQNTVRIMVEELVFLEPSRSRMVSIVSNRRDAYDDLCACGGRLSYNGELSALLFDLDRAQIQKEEYLSHYIAEDPVGEILLA